MNIADINAEARALVDADSTSYPDATLLRRVNAGYEEVVNEILNADGTWEFDDENFLTNPNGTINLTAGQSSYTFEERFLDVRSIKIKASDTRWHLLTPIDQKETDTPLEELLLVNGLPTHYDKLGSTIKLYPAPSAEAVTLTAGLKVEFTRTADLFTTEQVTTGTKEPGFAVNHIILAYMAALPYAISYKKDRVPALIDEKTRLMDGILKHYARREKDKRKVMTMKRISHR